MYCAKAPRGGAYKALRTLNGAGGGVRRLVLLRTRKGHGCVCGRTAGDQTAGDIHSVIDELDVRNRHTWPPASTRGTCQESKRVGGLLELLAIGKKASHSRRPPDGGLPEAFHKAR